MTIIKCAACSREISVRAASCPGCGEIPAKGTSRIALGIGAFVLIAIGMRACPATPKDGAVASSRGAVERAAVIATPTPSARQVLRSQSRDAGSMHFQNEFVSSSSGASCGQVNGKNGFGGYTGFSRFIVQGETAMIESPQEKSFDKAWARFCRK